MAEQEKKRRGSISELSSEQLARKSLDTFAIKGSNTHFVELLKSHVVNDLKTQPKIIELDTSAHTAMSGFQVLLTNNLLSAPVWDATTKQYIGFLHVRDLVSSIMFSIKSTRTRARSVSVAGSSSPPPPAVAVISEEIQSEAKFHADDWMKHAEVSITKKINDPLHTSTQELQLKYLARRNPFHPIRGELTLYEAAQLLSGKIHRAPVLGSDGKVVKLVTQSSIVDFLAEHLGDLKDDANQTVEGTSIGLRDVVSARGDRPALEAFMELDNHGLSGVAVVTRDGTIAGNTSAQDLRYFLLDRGALSLDMNLLDYLAAIRQQDVSVSDRAPVCSVGTSGTLGRIISLLSATGYHRVYVVDTRQCKPIGVVSLTDILKYATATVHLPLNPPETRQTRHSMSESRINSAAKLRVSVDMGRSRSPSFTPKSSLDSSRGEGRPISSVASPATEHGAKVSSPAKTRPSSPPKVAPPPPKIEGGAHGKLPKPSPAKPPPK